MQPGSGSVSGIAVQRLGQGRHVHFAGELVPLDGEEDEALGGERDGDDGGRRLEEGAKRELERQPAGKKVCRGPRKAAGRVGAAGAGRTDREVDPIVGRDDSRLVQARRQERERFEDAGRGRLGDDQLAAG